MAFSTDLGIPYEIDLEIHNRRIIKPIYAKQYDKEARYIVASLYNESSSYTIPTGATCVFGCKKRSTKIVESTATIQDNKIYYRLEEQVTAVDGEVDAEFTLTFNGVTLGCPKFKIYVEKGAVDTDDIEDSDDVNILTSLIIDATTAITNTNTATTNANTATTNANNVANQLTNETLIIWKPYVTTYSAIATTYPSPVKGWTTQCQDTGVSWRYNGTTWINIGTSTNDKVGDLTQLTTNTQTSAVSAINELDSVKAQYDDLDTQFGTSAHFTNAEDSIIEITKIEGATTVTPADPTKDISPDNEAVITNASNFKVMDCGKNFLPKPLLTSKTINGITFTYNESDDTITINGTATSIIYYIHTNLQGFTSKFKLHPGTYTYRNNYISGSFTGVCTTNIVNSVDSGAFAADATSNTSVTSTLSSMDDYSWGICITSGSVINNIVIKPQLEGGSSATAYELYKSNQISVPYEMLALPDGTKDTIEKCADEKWRRIHIAEKTVFDGSTDETVTINTTRFIGDYIGFNLTIPDAVSAPNDNISCNRFKTVSSEATGATYEGILSRGTTLVVGIKKARMTGWSDTLTDDEKVALFRTWLASNPITIQYKLATPIETIIDPLYLTSYPGITNAFTDANPQVNMTVAAKSELWNKNRLILAAQALQQTTSNMIQTDETDDAAKYPSSKVTHQHGLEIDALSSALVFDKAKKAITTISQTGVNWNGTNGTHYYYIESGSEAFIHFNIFVTASIAQNTSLQLASGLPVPFDEIITQIITHDNNGGILEIKIDTSGNLYVYATSNLIVSGYYYGILKYPKA